MPLWLTKRFWITENLLLGKLFSNYLYSKDHSPILVVFLFQLSFFVCVLFNDYYVESPCLVSLAGFHFLSSRQWFHSSINYHYFLLCVNLGAAPSSYFINFSNVQYFVFRLLVEMKFLDNPAIWRSSAFGENILSGNCKIIFI